MIITLTTGHWYNTELTRERRNVKKYVAGMSQARKDLEIKHIKAQIEQAQIVSREDISIYNYYDTFTQSRQFEQAHVPLKPKGNRYSFANGAFYQLPDEEDENTLANMLITKLLYENQRHDWNAPPCTTLRIILHKLLPDVHRDKNNNISIKTFQNHISKQEQENNTYYGENPSDDSDSEAEREYQKLPVPERKKIENEAKIYAGRANRYKYYNKIQAGLDSPAKDQAKGPTIYHSQPNQLWQADKDLKKINQQLADHGTLPEAFLAGLKTQFLVAQYRGVHYNTSGWGADERRQHRKLPEVGLPQFSGAVREACNINSFYDFVDIITKQDGRYDAMLNEAENVEGKLIQMQETGPVSYNGRVYISLFHLFQYWYSSDYGGLPGKIKRDLDKGATSYLHPFLNGTDRPLLSTGDTPWHALRYAYGSKYYDGQKDVRLRPRWDADGRSERPYSGKMYASLHPLNDYVDHRPSHITSMYYGGLLFLNSQISPERETSFLGSLPGDRVFLEHIAKYPSFKHGKPYKEIYLHKYGIDKPLYEVIKDKLANSRPHSPARKKLKDALGDYMCAYQEARLIGKAEKEANERDAILVYRDKNGGFSLVHPPTPTVASKTYKDVVNAKTALFKALSAILRANKKAEVTVLYGYKAQVAAAIGKQDDSYLPVQRDALRLLDHIDDGDLADTESKSSISSASTASSKATQPLVPKAKKKLFK